MGVLETYDSDKVLKVAQYKCRESLLFQTRYLFKKLQNRKFIIGEHHEKIAEALERVLSGQCKRLIINVPPRYGKTEVAVKNLIAHALGLNPKAKFIHLSYSDDLALDNSEEVRDIVTSAEYKEIYPEVKIKKDSKAKKKWYTTEGGGVYATAAGGQVTGFGAGLVEEEEQSDDDLNEFLDSIETTSTETNHILTKQNFGGAIVIDDPIKPEDADSDGQRERINYRFDSTIKSRVNSRNTPIIIVMQRLHPRDLSGYLIEQAPDDWEVISLPAIKEVMNEQGEKEFAALWPFKHSLEELRKLEKENAVVFARQYMQQSRPTEGLLFPIEELQFYNPEKMNPLELSEYGFNYTDPSDTGGDSLSSPFTCLVGDKIYVHDVIYNTLGTDENRDRIVNKIIQYKANAAEVEGNGGWVMFGKNIREKLTLPPPMGKGYSNCQVRVINNTQNKHSRILESSSFIKNHFVFRSDWRHIPEYKKFMECIIAYLRIQEGRNKNKEDDAPDSCTGIALYFRKHFPHIF